MMKLITILAAVGLAIMPLNAQMNDYHDALRLYEKGMLGRSKSMFDNLSAQTRKSDPAGYSVLCDVRSQVRGYENRMEAYFEKYPYSALISQIRYYHALNLFDAEKYQVAAQQFSFIEETGLYKDQRIEYVFKYAYCHLENGSTDMAYKGLLDVEGREYSDYKAPSRYALGYIEYSRKNFTEAFDWFEKASIDGRFNEMASYYMLECRFLLKDYGYVIEKGRRMFESAPADRRQHLARIISESYLVRDDVANARAFYDHALSSDKSENSRADWFYSGSLLYAVKDYKGAVGSFLNMGERCDSIGQIANYNLGYSYIQTKDKVSAMMAFKDASALDFDKAIKEDAMFNYAKLAFDLNNDISVFNDYLKKYPIDKNPDKIYSYMAVAALSNRDYEAAVEAFDKIEELDENMRLNYMKANYLRANQLIRNGSYRKAVPCLKAAAYYSDKRSAFNHLSRFWLAESYYRDGQYVQSRDEFMQLYNLSAFEGTHQAGLVTYGIAYCYFKEGNYKMAKKWFEDYLSGGSVKYRKEALVRTADCDFVQMNYKKAAAAYDAVLREYYNVNDIYPYYQAAISYGLTDNVARKVELLSGVMDAAPSSEFYPEALYELGRTYAVKEDDDKAFECFNKLVDTVKDSTFVAKAYIEMGTLARNQSMYNEALGYYKIVVEKMPLSGYADDALLAVESIYQIKNEPQEYLAYIESIGKGAVKTETEKESMIFNSAEQLFLSENYQKALNALQAYKESYPQGVNAYKADFYTAESCKALGMYEQACDAYVRVIEGGSGSFVELSMLNFANISYRLERWDDAFRGYSMLNASAQIPNNAYLAILGQMRSAYKGHDWKAALYWAQVTMSDSRADDLVKREAEYITAKSSLATSQREEAFEILRRLATDMSDAFGAESAYLLIHDSYDRGDFDDVENKVYAFADSKTGQTYWLAKSFIVLGDSFAERDEMEQAKATFESVRDGYTPSGEDDDVLDDVRFRLKRIEEMAAADNN